MSIQEREYTKRDHPPFCKCIGCERRNRERDLSGADKEKLDKALRKASEKIRFQKFVYAIGITLLVGALIGALVTGDAVWLGEAISKIHELFDHLRNLIQYI